MSLCKSEIQNGGAEILLKKMLKEDNFYFLTNLLAILSCVFVCIAWQYFHTIRSTEKSSDSNLWSNLFKDDRQTENALQVENEVKADVCTSTSCVRCSRSVYSTEKLLRKWKKIKEDLKPCEDTRKKFFNAIIKSSNQVYMNDGTRNIAKKQNPTVFYLEGLPGKIWYEKTANEFAEKLSILENDDFQQIVKSEFTNVYNYFKHEWVSNEVPSGGWYLYYLYNQGVKNEENCLRCPRVIKEIEKLEVAMLDCAFGNVVFSVLLPGTSIRLHCGPTNVRIRCHIPIIAPPGYFLMVGDVQYTWQEGKILIFDDSFYHKVYCCDNVHEPRVVLMLDLWHPSLLLSERELVKQIFSPQK